MNKRLQRELTTITAMAKIYCQAKHKTRLNLCVECTEVMEYAQARLGTCPFGDDKPTCVNCTVHCFSHKRREQVRQIMRYAGPRMLWRHPVLTLFHFHDKRRQAPQLETGIK